jgi:hypothetical protein
MKFVQNVRFSVIEFKLREAKSKQTALSSSLLPQNIYLFPTKRPVRPGRFVVGGNRSELKVVTWPTMKT